MICCVSVKWNALKSHWCLQLHLKILNKIIPYCLSLKLNVLQYIFLNKRKNKFKLNIFFTRFNHTKCDKQSQIYCGNRKINLRFSLIVIKQVFQTFYCIHSGDFLFVHYHYFSRPINVTTLRHFVFHNRLNKA